MRLLGIKLLTGLLCAGSAFAEVNSLPGVGSALLAMAIPILGFLLHRSIAQNDASIKSNNEAIKKIDDKLDRFLGVVGKLDKEVALVKQDHEHVKSEVVNLREWKHEIINDYLPALKKKT